MHITLVLYVQVLIVYIASLIFTFFKHLLCLGFSIIFCYFKVNSRVFLHNRVATLAVTQIKVGISGATTSVFPLDLVFFHFI